MTSYNPIKGITSKLILQARVAFWKIKFVTSDMLKR